MVKKASRIRHKRKVKKEKSLSLLAWPVPHSKEKLLIALGGTDAAVNQAPREKYD